MYLKEGKQVTVTFSVLSKISVREAVKDEKIKKNLHN